MDQVHKLDATSTVRANAKRCRGARPEDIASLRLRWPVRVAVRSYGGDTDVGLHRRFHQRVSHCADPLARDIPAVNPCQLARLPQGVIVMS